MSGDDFNEFARSFGRLEGKFDSLSDSIKTALANQASLNERHDKRLSRVEGRQHWMAGAGTFAGSIIGLFVSYFWGRH